MATTRQKKLKRTRPSRAKRVARGPNGGMEVLLIQSVEFLGDQGSVVEVKPGYARNYLFPQGLATVATDHHKRMVEKHRERLAEIQRQRRAGLQAQADEVSRQSVTIEANANEEGHLYGSVTGTEIADALKQQGFTITADQVRLEGPLKELGLYTVKVHIAHEIDAELKVWVVPTAGEEVPAAQTAEG
ncbi:MAG: 50S ribosomal protein L9 [Planctomycetales bacterium]|nr:50S ribosomal protein L9 [Planctomycetales bacterium]